MAEQKAKRAPRACDACRNRKIRCSGVDSNNAKCTRCLNMSIDCTFALPIKRPAPSSTVDELKGRIAFLEEKLTLRSQRNSITSLAGESEGYDDISDNVDDGDADVAVTTAVAEVSADEPGRMDAAAFVPTVLSVAGEVETRNLVRSFDTLSSDVDVNNRQMGGPESSVMASYLGSSSALFPLVVTRQIPKTIQSAIKAKVLLRYIRLEYWELRSAPTEQCLDEDLHAFWPTPEDAETLIDAYLLKIAPSQPLGLQKEALLRDYDADPDSVPSKIRLGRLYAMFALAAWHSNLGLEGVNNRIHLAGLPWWLASRRLVHDDADLSEPLVTAQTMLLQSLYAVSRPPLIAISWRLTGDALRVLVDIGAHRATVSKQLGHLCLERQLTLWTTYCMEKIIMSQTGRPPSLWAEWVDAQIPREENVACWINVEITFVVERILKAKYSARRFSEDITPERLKALLNRLDWIIEQITKNQDAVTEPIATNLRMGVAGARLLFHQAELLSTKTVSKKAIDQTVTAVALILDSAMSLPVADVHAVGVAALARACVLAHVLDQSTVPALQTAFVSRGFKIQAAKTLRKLEGRFMTAGKLCDLLSLPPLPADVDTKLGESGADRSSTPKFGSFKRSRVTTSHSSSSGQAASTPGTTPMSGRRSSSSGSSCAEKYTNSNGTGGSPITAPTSISPGSSSAWLPFDSNTLVFPSLGAFEWPVAGASQQAPSYVSPTSSSSGTASGALVMAEASPSSSLMNPGTAGTDTRTFSQEDLSFLLNFDVGGTMASGWF